MSIELTPEHEVIAAEARARIQAIIAGTAFVSEALQADTESVPEDVYVA